MVIDPKSNATMFAHKSLYLGLYSVKGLDNIAFIFGFGRGRQARTKRLLTEEFKQRSDFKDFKEKLHAQAAEAEEQALEDFGLNGQKPTQIELPAFITNADRNRHRMSSLSADREFKDEVGEHVDRILSGPVNDMKTLAYLDNWRRLKKVVHDRNDLQKKKMAQLHSQ